MLDRYGLRAHIAAEIRAEMARQRKTVDGAAKALGKSLNNLARKWRGEADFRPEELGELAEWMDVPVGQFLPPGYTIAEVPTMVVAGPGREVA